LVKCLENEGCKVVFGLPGEETIEILEALRSSSIKFFLTRHEATASFAADAYGRMTLRPGVCLSTLGPGATNLATGVADAYLDRAPVVAITGQTQSYKLGMQRHQLIGLQEFFRPITKWTALLGNGDVIPEKIRKAYTVAKSTPMGPVHLDFPVDIQAYETMKNPLPKEKKWIVKEPIVGEKLRIVAEKINKAEFPVVVTGLSCVRRGHHESLRRFAESYGIPVITTPLSKGILPTGHELSFGVISPLCPTVTLKLIQRSDLIITVGYDFLEIDVKLWIKRNAEIIHIDYLPADVDEAYNPSTEVLGNIGAVLDALTKLAGKRRKTDALVNYKRGIMEELSSGNDSGEFPVKPQRLIKDLREATEKNAIICVDTGAVKYLMTRYWRVYAKRTFFLSSGLAAMGFAIPASMAGSMVFPGRQVVAVIGDGGLQMSLSDLPTLAENKMDVTIVLFDNAAYGIVAANQKLSGKRIFGTTYTNPDFCEIAEASGLKAYEVTKASEVYPMLREALNDGVPSLVRVPVQRTETEIIRQSKF
ncbi:MAG: acetolactate synthase large subunit, partial [Candidatus Hydrothermarchaeota archaeon]|nr:acetolactate synthase large subunit [Candidatus Hydrothermarchaeota archaeon]